MASSSVASCLLPLTTCCSGAVSALAAAAGDDDLLLQHKPRFDDHPSVWGDYFLTFSPCTPSTLQDMKNKARAMNEQVRRMILGCSSAAASGHDLRSKLELVDTLERLGIDYHYTKEIDDVLRMVHEEEEDDANNNCDLHTTALRFYLLRKHGYRVSPDVFLRFRDEEGNFVCEDDDDDDKATRSMLSLYNAAYVRIHGEEILNEAIVFTRSYLRSAMKRGRLLRSPMADEVRYALETPLFRRPRRVEARHYISVYAKLPARNDTILEFARLDFGILQALYCDELKELTMWWREVQLQDHVSFARDRMVEMHFWMVGVVFEPQYSYGRIMLTKLFIFVSIFDDLYDSYSTLEESNLFTIAMERWDEEAAEQLPGYLKLFYKKLINASQCYYNEAEWRAHGAVAATVQDHLKISVPSSCCMHVPVYAFISMGNDVVAAAAGDGHHEDAVDWGMAYPKIIRSSCVVGRVVNDIASHEREKESSSEQVDASTVEACMREHGGITKQEAYGKLRELVEESWMDIAEECLRPAAQPAPLLEAVVNATRTLDFLYKDDHDAYTLPHELKDTIGAIYVDSI
ncbi:hypothetical protein GUJ93_ZPchr0010g9909 [Zizania palustris]|uniref:Terpene synthase n=1 Tax=Zizania palustris TaxID=103762 RepID=A0A8J6BPK1_ZIZPA|nr:hypothetical protein GUJ93_ZPchr0010g9909 [Zizania palustris]